MSAAELDAALSDRLSALTDAQAELLAVRLSERTGTNGDEGAEPARGGASRLVAFVAARDGAGVEVESLRAHLAGRLPPYMVPQAFTVVDALPRNDALKLDRRALLRLGAGAGDTARKPVDQGERTAPERELAAIWCEVLGLSEVGVDEDFFELGGDSLLSIRILARANQKGLHISPEDFFAQPTVAGQAALCGAARSVQAERGPVTGDVALTPIQHWFFERIPIDPHHWNQSFLFRLARPLGLSTLERAVQALLHHHDALRIEFREGEPRVQSIAEPDASLPVSELDLGGVEDANVAGRIEAHASELNATLDLSRGPLFRAVLVHPPGAAAGRVLLIAHHLVVDALSWRLIVEDLERACGQAERGERIELGAKTTSFKRWSERLAEYAQSGTVTAELEHWRRASAASSRLPVDRSVPGDANRFSGLRTLVTSLGPHDTRAVLRELPAAFGSRINESLLAALAIAMRRWTGESGLRLDVEGHGRDAPFDDLDVSRTVGWFTTVYPVALTLPPGDDPVAALTQIKAQLRSVPAAGIGHGLLRELARDPALRSAKRSELLFNYLGQIETSGVADRLLTLESEACGHPRSPAGDRAYLLEINARVYDSNLELHLGFSSAFHDESTMAALSADIVAALRSFVAAARGGETSARTPSDFPLADLDQADLEGLARVLGEADADDSDSGSGAHR